MNVGSVDIGGKEERKIFQKHVHVANVMIGIKRRQRKMKTKNPILQRIVEKTNERNKQLQAPFAERMVEEIAQGQRK